MTLQDSLQLLRSRGYECEADGTERIIIRTARGIFVLNAERAHNFNLFPSERKVVPIGIPAKRGDLIEVEVMGHVVTAVVQSVRKAKK